MKARVYWDGEFWVAEVDHGSWTDSTPFGCWGLAQDHANWLGDREARRP